MEAWEPEYPLPDATLRNASIDAARSLPMIRCDYFELVLHLGERNERRTLRYSYRTDLPAGTLAIVTCSRRYQDREGNDQLWLMASERVSVEPTADGDLNGGDGTIDIDVGDAAGRVRFDQLGGFSKGIRGEVSDQVCLELIVGGRQRLEAFGAGNRNLRGAMVTEESPVHVVEVSDAVIAPIRGEHKPT